MRYTDRLPTSIVAYYDGERRVELHHGELIMVEGTTSRTYVSNQFWN